MKHKSHGQFLLDLLSGNYKIKQNDIGADAHLSKKGFHFDTQTYTIENLGHLCIMKMKAMFGLMQMETIVLSVTHKDVPLLNMDWVGVPGRQTMLGELYDTQIAPWPDRRQQPYRKILERDGNLPDYRSGSAHWYDSILYPCSYHKSGKGISSRLDASATTFARVSVRQLETAPSCEPAVKEHKAKEFAENLVSHGGPAVDQVTKLFGAETARRLILHHMYGIMEY